MKIDTKKFSPQKFRLYLFRFGFDSIFDTPCQVTKLISEHYTFLVNSSVGILLIFQAISRRCSPLRRRENFHLTFSPWPRKFPPVFCGHVCGYRILLSQKPPPLAIMCLSNLWLHKAAIIEFRYKGACRVFTRPQKHDYGYGGNLIGD